MYVHVCLHVYGNGVIVYGLKGIEVEDRRLGGNIRGRDGDRDLR